MAEDKTTDKDAKNADAPPPETRRLIHNPVYPTLMLGLFALAAAASLGYGNKATEGPIAERHAEDLRASLSQVIPDSRHDNDPSADTLRIGDHTVYRATRGGRVTGVAFETVGYGYGGAIVVLLGVDADGAILGARVLKHAETPGLGDKIEASRDDWILGFDGLSLDGTPSKDWAVKKDGGRFDQFSGATITPRAVVKAIKQGLEFFATHKGRLLAAAQTEAGT